MPFGHIVSPMNTGALRLAAEMRARGLTQAEVGTLVGCDGSIVSRLLHDDRRPTLRLAARFEAEFGIPIAAWMSDVVEAARRKRAA